MADDFIVMLEGMVRDHQHRIVILQNAIEQHRANQRPELPDPDKPWKKINSAYETIAEAGPEGAIPDVIAAACDTDRAYAKKLAKQLVERGLVTQPSENRYTIT